MGSILGDLPSFDPHNFSQHSPSDPPNPFKMTPVTYHPTHSQAIPPSDQVISTEAKNFLLKNFYERSDEKRAGAEVVECACVIELPDLKGRERLNGKPLYILVETH